MNIKKVYIDNMHRGQCPWIETALEARNFQFRLTPHGVMCKDHNQQIALVPYAACVVWFEGEDIDAAVEALNAAALPSRKRKGKRTTSAGSESPADDAGDPDDGQGLGPLPASV